MVEFWNSRYSSSDYAYGTLPNQFFKEQLRLLQAGSMLLPAEGEGRNAVYAATLGWKVSAFDISEAGKKKAEWLAAEKGVTIDYTVAPLEKVEYAKEQFDALALIFAHFPAALRSDYHNTLGEFVKKGGLVILEAFSKKQVEYNAINEKAGGPKDMAMLYSIEEISEDFAGFDTIELSEQIVELSEGAFHQGRSSVIRYVGKKL